jgi:small-conductance mechanosensitive channel
MDRLKLDRSKIVAVITGVISLMLAIGYLVLVQILDFRGDMVPAPLSTLAGPLRLALGFIAQGS